MNTQRPTSSATSLPGALPGPIGAATSLDDGNQHHTLSGEEGGRRGNGAVHDLGNVLQTVIGNAECVRGELPHSHPAHESLVQILSATRRARGLLAQMQSPGPNHQAGRRHVRALIEEILRLLRATVPRTIEIVSELSPADIPLAADSFQLQRVLLSLFTQSMQSMRPGGGVLTVRQSLASFSAESLPPLPGLRAGKHVKVEVSDTGTGAAPAELHRLLDPFFAIKQAGENGGLSTSLGVMHGNEGVIVIYSEPGRGSTYTLYLAAASQVAIPQKDSWTDGVAGRRKRILVVDDEEAVGILTARMLRQLGFDAVVFENPEEAVAVLADAPEQVDLIVTDFCMPQLSGAELIERVRAIRPDLPVVVTTGYSDELEADHPIVMSTCQVLRKPFDMATLAHTARGILSGAARKVAPA